MGKQRVNIYISLTAVFAAFVLGFYMGRNYNPSPVQISRLTAAAETVSSTEPPSTSFETTSPVETESVTEPITETTASTEETTSHIEEDVATEAAKETSATEARKSTESASTGSGLININTASASLLETLPGIGEVLAQRIVEYRNTYGPFKSVYALTNVKGIGEKRLAAIIHLITV